MPSWFADSLRAEMATRRLARQADLARLLGKPTATVSRWLSGTSEPAFQELNFVAQQLGWDFSRALPGWQPEEKQMIEIAGTVAAGAIQIAVEDRKQIEAASGAWRKSLYWPHTAGPVVFLEVSGDSMEPDFHDGSFVACRRPLDARKIPLLAPCVFRVGDEATFKCYQPGPDGHTIGVPLNRSLPVLLFRNTEVAIDYIVLGQLDPWRRGARAPAKGGVMEDSKGGKTSRTPRR